MSSAQDQEIKRLAEQLPVGARQGFVDAYTPTAHGLIDEAERIECAAYSAAPAPRLLLLTSTHLYLSRGPADVETRARGSITNARAEGRDLVVRALAEERFDGLMPETAAADIVRSLSKPLQHSMSRLRTAPSLRTIKW